MALPASAAATAPSRWIWPLSRHGGQQHQPDARLALIAGLAEQPAHGGRHDPRPRAAILSYVSDTANFPYGNPPTALQQSNRIRAAVHLIITSPDSLFKNNHGRKNHVLHAAALHPAGRLRGARHLGLDQRHPRSAHHQCRHGADNGYGLQGARLCLSPGRERCE